MLSEQSSEQRQTVSEALAHINSLIHQIEAHPSFLQANLRAFVSIYVRMNTLSEDFFIALCEYEVIQKLFRTEESKLSVISALEMFNLVLANTNQINSLVYIFSQASLHEFLFSRFDLIKENSETVEYYVQLLKTIIMKMSNGNASLIKLFCNNRYASFPLLSHVSYLATQHPEELVRVTAQQCVLLLIQLLNIKNVGCGYLSELQMAVLFYELTQQLQQQQRDLQGCLKYLVDLIVALQKNDISLFMLLNAFSVNGIARNIQNLPLVLKIMRTFWQMLEEHEEFPEVLGWEIKAILGKIICRYCFNQFLDGTSFSVLMWKQGSLEKVSYSSLLKYYKSRFQHLLPFLEQADSKQEKLTNEEKLFSGWLEFNNSRELRDLKSREEKKSIFNFFLFKQDPTEAYVKKVLQANGLKVDGNLPLVKLEKTVNWRSGIFFMEKLLASHKREKGVADKAVEQVQVHFNDNRGNFDLTEAFCEEAIRMTESLQKQGVSLNKIMSSQSLKNMEFEYNFLRKLKLFLLNRLSDYILLANKEFDLTQIRSMRKLLGKLQLYYHLDKNTMQKLLWKLEQLQSEINELTFMRDYKLLIKYVLHDYSQFLQKGEKGIPKDAQDHIINKTMNYELIVGIIDPKVETLSGYVRDKWSDFITSSSNIGKFSILKETKDYQIRISPLATLEFEIRFCNRSEGEILMLNAKEAKFSKASESQKVAESSQSWKAFYGSIVEAQLAAVCSLREQAITKWVVQYFEDVYNRLCSLIKSKNDKFMMIHMQ